MAYLLRGRRPGFYPALVAAISLAAAFFIVWLALTNVANSETPKRTADSIPADWAAWRRRWEFSRATRFVLHLAGLALLVFPFVASAAALDARRRTTA